MKCDTGKEYLNDRFYKFAKEKGIILNNCPVYVHELNGTAERFNRTIMAMAQCLLTEANVHKCFWPEIICAATYLKNRTLTNTIERKTPYEIFFISGRMSNIYVCTGVEFLLENWNKKEFLNGIKRQIWESY